MLDLKILKYIHNTLKVPYKKSKIISFTSSGMNDIIVSPEQYRFLLDHSQVLPVCLALLQSTYNFVWNKDNLIDNQLSNNLLDK